MILGRNPGLILAVVAAALNVAVVVLGIHLNADQLASLNALAVAVVGVVANEADPTTAGTLAPTTKAPPATAQTPSSGPFRSGGTGA